MKNPPGFSDCTVDSDNDAIVDCIDTCVDADEDGLGNGTNNNSACGNPADDCDDTSDLCTTTCDDQDGDDVWDCKDTCVDEDGDGVGNGHLDNNGCVIQDTDSNDGAQNTCADTDHDTCDDCANGSWDSSNDGDDNDSDGICNAGDPADGNPNRCGDWDGDTCDDCAFHSYDPAHDGVDVDEDGTCDRADCKDNDDSCTTDCTACPPTGLAVTIENAPLCEPATVTIDLDAYTGAAAELTCKSGDTVHGVTLDGPTTFANEDWGSWGVTSGAVKLELWRDYTGLDCSDVDGDYFAHFDSSSPTAYIELKDPLDLTGWENVRITFRADYRDNPGAGDNLRVVSCCGSDCSPSELPYGTVPNANDGGNNDCRPVEIKVPDGTGPDDTGCPNLMLGIAFNSTKGQAAVDDIEILGDLMFSSITETAEPGVYETTATSCLAASEPVPVACYWPDAADPVVSDDSETIEWQ